MGAQVWGRVEDRSQARARVGAVDRQRREQPPLAGESTSPADQCQRLQRAFVIGQ
jgi:hypothetical protein